MLAGHSAQVWRHQPAYLRPRHFHAEPEINWVLRGNARLAVGERSYELRAGDFVLLPPGLDHALLAASDDLEFFVAALMPDLAARALANPSAVFHGTHHLEEFEREQLRGVLLSLAQVRDPLAHQTRLAALFQTAASTTQPPPSLSRRVLLGMAADLTTSASALARKLRVAPSQVSRSFHDDVGILLSQYRARQRLMRFISAVDRGHTLTRAALEADFGSYAQCHRVFWRALRCSPKDYFAGVREHINATTACAFG